MSWVGAMGMETGSQLGTAMSWDFAVATMPWCMPSTSSRLELRTRQAMSVMLWCTVAKARSASSCAVARALEIWSMMSWKLCSYCTMNNATWPRALFSLSLTMRRVLSASVYAFCPMPLRLSLASLSLVMKLSRLCTAKVTDVSRRFPSAVWPARVSASAMVSAVRSTISRKLAHFVQSSLTASLLAFSKSGRTVLPPNVSVRLSSANILAFSSTVALSSTSASCLTKLRAWFNAAATFFATSAAMRCTTSPACWTLSPASSAISPTSSVMSLTLSFTASQVSPMLGHFPPTSTPVCSAAAVCPWSKTEKSSRLGADAPPQPRTRVRVRTTFMAAMAKIQSKRKIPRVVLGLEPTA
mmetsp:Transcript_79682/g.184998  ORF Transcript_79682/g.184998 Transcript_79682/m.184998 type:complete len:356 (-) Transcript_79682:2-1069(-)